MNKVAVVTGASYGLGRSISLELLEDGYKVYGISRTEPALKHNDYVWLKADLMIDSDIDSIPTKILEDSVDLLVNNAGTCFLQSILDYTDDDFEKMYGLNVKSQIKLTQKLFPKLTNGLIINISSLSDRYPDKGYGIYGSSKAALNLLFETFAEENPNIKVINLLPSYIDTPLQHELSDHRDFDWKQCMTMEDVASSVEEIIQTSEKFESGSKIIIQKKIEKNEKFNPEKLWVYTTDDKNLIKAH